MKKIIFAFLLVVSPIIAFADTTATVDVPDHCTVVDSLGTPHVYSGSYLAICALQQALDDHAVSSIKFSDFGIGLFVDSVDGVLPPANSYWQLQRNITPASVGASSLPVSAGDTIALVLMQYDPETFLDIGPIGNSNLMLHIGSLQSAGSATPTFAGSGTTRHDPFDVEKALTYLWDMQLPDGSFGSPLLDDWVAIGSSVGGFGDMRKKLAEYEVGHPLISSVVTDNERHAMALEALGIDPRTGTSVDYIDPIVRSFDGTQIGDPHLDNDDIFAIFPLMKAGYEANDDIIKKTAAFIVSAQNDDGSWDASMDMTGAAIQALALSGGSDAEGAIAKAIAYLHGKQGEDASVGNSFSTSWVIQAITATGGSVTDWDRDANTLDYYLATQQDFDGGVGTSTAGADTRIWATSLAIPAEKRRTWDSMLQSFSRPAATEPVATASTTPTPAATSTVAHTNAKPIAVTKSVKKPITAVKPAATPATAALPEQNSVQTASAASANPGFLSSFGHAISSFFARLF